jgi:hypothetical protein
LWQNNFLITLHHDFANGVPACVDWNFTEKDQGAISQFAIVACMKY